MANKERKKLSNLTEVLKTSLQDKGADLVKFGDISNLPKEQTELLPIGISIAVKYPKEVILGIKDNPTKEYFDHYHMINNKLDELASFCSEILISNGYKAIPQTRDYVNRFSTEYSSRLPQKTVATAAGLGFIGKSALLVTQEYGSAVRLSSVLTDAPLQTDAAITATQCKSCNLCVEACPAKAILGDNWSLEAGRDAIYNAELCRNKARELSLKSFGVDITICGKCIHVCPYTQAYLKN